MDLNEILDRLDKTLKYILDTNDGTTMADFKLSNPVLWSIDSEFNMAFRKLIQDGLIEKDPNGDGIPIYRPTILGFSFEGYVNTRNKTHAQIIQTGKLQKEQMDTQKYLLYLTILIAVSTALSAIYYVYFLIQDILKH